LLGQLPEVLLTVVVLALAARFFLLHMSQKTREVELKEAAKLVCIYMRK
jgi:hypothetical protein